MNALDTPVLSVNGIGLQYRNGVRALSDVTFDLHRGEILGVVGESGSGKTTLVNVLLLLTRPQAGSVLLNGNDLAGAGRREIRAMRRRVQAVFQDPGTSLNPRLTAVESVAFNLAPLRLGRRETRRRAVEVLDRVGIPSSHMDRRPVSLSGGQIQRVAIARALVNGPEVVVCDEAVSALDKSVQAQVLNLLRELREELEVSMLFISHDLQVVDHLCDRVLVMHRGRVVEEGPISAVMASPQHPYTQLLLDSIPRRASRQPPVVTPQIVIQPQGSTRR